MLSVWPYSARRLNGSDEALSAYRDRVLLIVNVASKCGFTPQYAGLEALYRTYRDKGFSVLGFPCNQFGAQEPGDAAEIANFCSARYDITFPLFEKIEVNGAGAHPLYRFLSGAKRGLFGSRRIKWNFTKFLVDRTGQVTARFGPGVKPEALEDAVRKLL